MANRTSKHNRESSTKRTTTKILFGMLIFMDSSVHSILVNSLFVEKKELSKALFVISSYDQKNFCQSKYILNLKNRNYIFS